MIIYKRISIIFLRLGVCVFGYICVCMHACMWVCTHVRLRVLCLRKCNWCVSVYACCMLVRLSEIYEGMYYVHVAYSFARYAARIPGYTYIIMIVSKYILATSLQRSSCYPNCIGAVGYFLRVGVYVASWRTRSVSETLSLAVSVPATYNYFHGRSIPGPLFTVKEDIFLRMFWKAFALKMTCV